MKIYLAADHAGFELKERIKEVLLDDGHDVEDCGAHKFNQEDDYPDFIGVAAKAVSKDPDSRGILFGGTGQGEAMVANRVKGVRAAVFYGPERPRGPIDVRGKTSNDPLEIVKLPRAHEDANIISIGVRFVKEKEALEVIKLWLETPFSEEERHQRRLDKF